MWKYIPTSETSSDCTQCYDVELDGSYTVEEFIHEVLDKRSDEWGYIRVKEKRNKSNLYGLPASENRYGSILTDLPEKYMNEIVKSVKADGGWSAMDYVLQV